MLAVDETEDQRRSEQNSRTELGIRLGSEDECIRERATSKHSMNEIIRISSGGTALKNEARLDWEEKEIDLLESQIAKRNELEQRRTVFRRDMSQWMRKARNETRDSASKRKG